MLCHSGPTIAEIALLRLSSYAAMLPLLQNPVPNTKDLTIKNTKEDVDDESMLVIPNSAETGRTTSCFIVKKGVLGINVGSLISNMVFSLQVGDDRSEFGTNLICIF